MTQGLGKFYQVLIISLIIFLVLGLILFTPKKAQALSWSQANTDGFGVSSNWGEIDLTVFQNNIYVGVGNDSGAQMYRSSDGTIWNSITTNGFGNTNNVYFGDMEFGSYLYVSTIKSSASGEGAEIWRSSSGDSGSFTQVNTDGFGDSQNRGIEAMVIFGDYLYAGTCYNSTTGAEVWRSSDGSTWTQVNSDGFGSAANYCIRSLKVYSSQIYAGLGNSTIGAQLYRSSDGTTWSQVVSDGLGDTNNSDFSLLEEFNSNLYAGTINGSTGTELWRSSTGNSSSFSQVNTDGFGNSNNIWSSYQGAIINGTFWIGTRNDTNGGQLWSSTNGTTWTQESTSGFGDSNNYAIYAVTFKSRIYIGFSNATTGTEIWRSEALTELVISTSSLSAGQVNSSYSATLETASGTSSYTWSLSSGSLPPGLSLSSGGVISGTPTTSGTYNFTVSVTDSGTPSQSASKSLSLIIDPVSSTLTSTTSASTTSASTTSTTSAAKELPETGKEISLIWFFGFLPFLLLFLFFGLKLRNRKCD